MGVPKVYLPIIEKMQMKTVNQWTGWLWSTTTYLNELNPRHKYIQWRVTWEPTGKSLSEALETFSLACLRLQGLSAKVFANLILGHYVQISSGLALSVDRVPAASLGELKEPLQKTSDLLCPFHHNWLPT